MGMNAILNKSKYLARKLFTVQIFPKNFLTKKNSTTTKKRFKKEQAKIEHNEALILFYKHNSLLLSLYYQVRKPPPRVCHSFNEKKPAKKDAGRIPETETHSKKTR